MCYSAEVSFGLSLGLLPAGIYCVKSAVAKNLLLVPVGIIPILFGFQQICEGFAWTGLARGDLELVKWASMLFLFFAIALWPFWVPFCYYFTEKGGRKKAIYGVLAVLGSIVGLSVYLPLVINAEFPLANVEHHSIHYDIARSPAFEYFPLSLWLVVYVFVVCSPLLSSVNRRLLFLGIAVVLSAAISYVVFWQTFVSVWCFFAAALSLYLCVYFRNLPPAERATNSTGRE
jgi:hypothetical protein